MIRWKEEGPSDSFKALFDMAAVHSSCRLCIHLASRIIEKEENSPVLKKRPCSCTRGPETVYHLYVRERGRFQMESIFLRYDTFFSTDSSKLCFMQISISYEPTSLSIKACFAVVVPSVMLCIKDLHTDLKVSLGR